MKRKESGQRSKALTAMILIDVILLVLAFFIFLQIRKGSSSAESAETASLESLPSSADVAADTSEETTTSSMEESDARLETTESETAPSVPDQPLIIDSDPELYTYTDYCQDTELLLLRYPDLLQSEDLDTTIDGRAFKVLSVGDPESSHTILINAGIHAREYITCQLVMKQLTEFLRAWENEETYQGYSIRELLDDTRILVIPMVNPDGISISQFGMEGIQTDNVRLMVESIASADGTSTSDSTYLRRWKANANGVDLNRNFDALWERYTGAGHISSDHYKGTSIGCEIESAALIALTETEQPDRTISYHTQGSVIYWYFAQEGALYDQSLTFAERIRQVTGYPLDADYENLDPAGYKDWCIYRKGIPSLTIEVGRETSPVPAEQFQTIWNQNEFVWYETLIDILENS